MAIYNNGSYNGYPAFRLEDGKVLGRLKEGVKSAFPAVGGQDFRFFVEPLSPLPHGYEDAKRLGFTGFMSRIGYHCGEFASEEDAWKRLSEDWKGQLVLFTPALRNNKYFVIDDVQKEAAPEVLEETAQLLSIPVFGAEDDPTFDGDINKFCLHMAEGKPMPGLSRKYWNRSQRTPLVAASFRHPDAAKKRMYALFAPLHADTFQNVDIGEGGAYFETEGRGGLGYVILDMTAPDIASRCVMCRTAPLCFVPEDFLAYLKRDIRPVPADSRILPAASPRRGGFPMLRGQGRILPEGLGKMAESGRPAIREERKAAPPARSQAHAAPEEDADAGKQGKMQGEKNRRNEAAESAAAKKPEAFTEKAFLARLAEGAKKKGLLYNARDLVNFHVSVKSSRLVILAGMSGTGKSGLVRLYADALGLGDSQFAMVPVRPSWMDDNDLLGYLDMRNMVYRSADTGLAELLIEAEKHPEKLYAVCFDEMNLARAEHYFAQFISALEKENPVIRLYNPALMPRVYNSAAYPAEIRVGRNVIFTGTVNVDESTYHFSDKILDRANVITLRQGKFRDLLQLPKEEALQYPEVSAGEFLRFHKDADGVGLSSAELDFLDALNEAFTEGGAAGGIGYRVARQMGAYLTNLPETADFSRGDGLDCQTVQRILTKLRGSAEQLKTLVSTGEKGELSGTAAGVLDRFQNLSAFTASRAVLQRKARELKLYDYTI